jgi:hypothetical protein
VLRATTLVAAFVLGIPVVAYGQNAFEIQVYDSTTAPRGEVGIETHLNQHVIDGAAAG